jgi:AMP-polyphosphate phosphotransferase
MSLSVKVRKGFDLAKLDRDRALSGEAEYQSRLKELQIRMLSIQEAYRRDGRRAIIVFEGRDAAGKGGTIKRLIERLDPRGIHVWQIGAPEAEEQARHYLFRFWEKLPVPGSITIFDRSWYGRVLVERVEKLASHKEWNRAYEEINEFERMLAADGVRLVKIFLDVSPEEQLRRLRERIAVPVKQWKITAADILGRALWDEYTDAIEDMLERCSTAIAPWYVVAADRKWFARIAVAERVTRVLAKDIDLAPPELDPAIRAAVLEHFGPAGLREFGIEG